MNDSNENSHSIRLDQFLKLHRIVQSGGEAKHFIQAGEVKVNGEVEVRRGRKLHHGDVVEALGQQHAVNDASKNT